MYIFDEMIELGLPEGEEWPSKLHKKLAMNVLLCNPDITTRDSLIEGVKIILKIPEEEIPTLTYEKLVKYGFRARLFV